MHIVLFGGSFNPPHLGHLFVIAQAFELIPDIDELWLLPAYHHTFGKHLAPPNHRLAMCSLLIKECAPPEPPNRLQLCSLEIDHHMSGETYETLQLLKKQYPDHSFSFLMGSDQLPHFTKWGHWQQLLKEMHFFIYPRAGHRHTISFPNMTLLDSPTQVITNISSTLIRHRLENQLPIPHLLPESITDYISTNHLYTGNT